MTDPEAVTRCPLPAVAAWRWYPSAGQHSTLPGVVHCRHHQAAAKAQAEALALAGHYLHHDPYREGSDIRCQVGALPDTEADAMRIAELVDEARSVLSRLSSLTANARGVFALVGNEQAVWDALAGLAVDAAAEADVVRSRTEHRRG